MKKSMFSFIATGALCATNLFGGALDTTIIHINDHHSHLNADSMKLKFNGQSTYSKVGGFARVVTKVSALQKESKNPITLHAGDALQGTLFYSLFKGEADAKMMNFIDWDAFVLGNHEFDDGDAALAEFLDQLNPSINVLAANVKVRKGAKNPLTGKWKPYMIKEINGEKVGIIGIDVKQKTLSSSNPGKDILFSDETETAQKYADELKKTGVDKIILLSHYGYENELKLAQNIKGIDVIIGGDSHTLLGDFSEVGLKTKAGYDYPTLTTSASGEPVCVAQAWQYSHIVGKLDVSFDDKGIVKSCAGTPTLLIADHFRRKNKEGKKVAVDAKAHDEITSIIARHPNLELVMEDKAAKAALAGYNDKVKELTQKKIGEAAVSLGHNRIPNDGRDGYKLPLGSDIAPLVSKSFYALSKRADACIQNAGGVRISIPAGEISVGLAYKLLPFANTLYELEMKGSEVKQVLEDALTNHFDKSGSSGSFPYAYALRYDVDMTKAANDRIRNLEVMDRASKKWGKIDADRMYVIVTNSYTAGGKDGYLTFKTVQDQRGPGVDTYFDYAMSFAKYVEARTEEGKKVEKLPASEHPIKSYTPPKK